MLSANHSVVEAYHTKRQAPQPVMASSSHRTGGSVHSSVAMMPATAYASAANGSACRQQAHIVRRGQVMIMEALPWYPPGLMPVRQMAAPAASSRMQVDHKLGQACSVQVLGRSAAEGAI